MLRAFRSGMRGVRVVTNVGQGMRWAQPVAWHDHADEQSAAHGEIVWSWSPGAETKLAML